MPLPLAALLPLVATLAPGLIGHLAGDRAEQVAEEVSTAVRAVVGTEDPAEVRLALQDPARAAELRVELARIEDAAETERLRLLLADVAGARAQTVDLVRAGSPIAWGAVVVSAIVLVAFGVATWAVLTQALPEASRDPAIYLLGVLGTMATAVVGYWVGSSAGSARKDEALRQVAGVRR